MKCTVCGKALERGRVTHAVEVAGRTFIGNVPALLCAPCNESLIDGAVLERFDLLAARELAHAGVRSGEAFRFMRRALGLSGQAVAAELDTTPETISRWEREEGGRKPEPFHWIVLAGLVRDELEGGQETRTLLRALRSRPALAKTVRLDVDEPAAAASV